MGQAQVDEEKAANDDAEEDEGVRRKEGRRLGLYQRNSRQVKGLSVYENSALKAVPKTPRYHMYVGRL